MLITPKKNEKIIFLAGPTERKQVQDGKLTQWRQDAIKILEEIFFDGVVCIPEPYTGAHDQQVSWEQDWLAKADTIIFWIPRNYTNGMYATTTNLEFGQYISHGSPKVMYGRPVDAQSTSSNDWHAKKNGVNVFDNLKLLLIETVSSICGIK